VWKWIDLDSVKAGATLPANLVWKWIDLDSVNAGATLPANLDREVTDIYPTANPGCQTAITSSWLN
jgi:hypothetical protein